MTYYSELAPYFIRMAGNLILVGTPIAICIFTVLRLTRAAHPRVRYLLAVAGFFVAAIAPFVLAISSTPETPPAETIVSSPITDAPVPTAEPPAEGEPDVTGNILDSVMSFLSEPSFSTGAFTVWLIGACLLLSREIASHLRVARVRRRWTTASPRIRERLSWPKDRPLFVENELGPCAIGVFNPVVIIPARVVEELSLPAVRQIAQHELDHLKWRDPSVNAVMRIFCALLWVSAPLWYLYRAARLEREAASDRAAVNATSGALQPDVIAVEYAATLVSVARSCARAGQTRRRAWITTEIGNETDLNERVRRLMAISSRLTSTRLSLALGVLLVCTGSLIILPVARLESEVNATLPRIPLPSPPGFEPGQLNEANTPAATGNDRIVREPRSRPEDSNPVAATLEAAVAAAPPATNIVAVNTVQPELNVQPGDLESQMAAVGYSNLTSEQLEKMRAYAVGPAYVKEMAESGYSGLSADMLIRFKWFAVSSSFIREMRTLGYDNLPARVLLDFRQHGVNADYIRQMRTRISGPISGEQFASLRFHGTTIDFVDKLKALGYANLTAEQLIGMRLHGVSIGFIQDLQTRGQTSLSADDLIGIRMRGSN